VVLVLAGPAGAASFRFTLTSDNRPVNPANLPYWEWVLDEISRNVGDEGVFHIIPGDFDYPGITDASLKAQFGDDVVWYPVIGNHELDQEPGSGDDYAWVVGAYSGLPWIVNSGPPGCETTTYSWDYGNAHFVALNLYYDGTSDRGTDGDVVDELYDWLAADLAENTKPVVFVIGHEPAYALVRHVEDSLNKYPANRDRFWKLLNDERVVAYFCGHSHWYSARRVGGANWYPFTWQIDCGNAGTTVINTFVDVTVTQTDVTFNIWQAYTWSPFVPVAFGNTATITAPLTATIYVDGASGSDSQGSGTEAEPYKTVAKAYEVAADGDTIVVVSGNYPENLTLNKRVTIRAEGGLVRIGQ